MSMAYIAPADRHRCNICGDQFADKPALVGHVHAVHSFRSLSPRDRPRNRGPVPCGHPGCDQTFQSPTSATQHRKAKHNAA